MTRKFTAILMAIAIVTGSFATDAQALGRKDRQILTGVVIGAGAATLIRKGREARHEREARERDQIAAGTVDAAIDNAGTSFGAMGRSDRLSLQRNMRAAGYYGGGIDGAWGPGMRTAFLLLFRDNPRAARVSADRAAVRGFMSDLARV
ncbi:peptidoglycan-binding domain-containing protein [Paracoccus sp. ME4]|uniref:peptidoglycan-binding domain-containing protein n=1 Tax=Paracoccus sp. ME4 TaxID=3138066 RepID=UPI00398B7A07